LIPLLRFPALVGPGSCGTQGTECPGLSPQYRFNLTASRRARPRVTDFRSEPDLELATKRQIGMVLTHELPRCYRGQRIYLGSADGAAFLVGSGGMAGTSSATLHCST
jgi:hypothetical protein